VKGGTRHPLDSPGNKADPCGFAVSVDWEAAQITLRGRPTGAGGGASLTPAPGVELVFDRVDGWLSCVIVEAGEPGTAVAPGKGAIAFIASVFGAETARAVREAPSGEVRCLALRARPGKIGVLSRLARLDAARVTSPVSGSPLWAAEASDLARQADLPRVGEARRASVTIPNGLGSTIPAEVLAQFPAVGGPGPFAGPEPFAGAGPGHGGRLPDGWLDLGLVPDGMFRPGLWPESDLGVRAYRDGAPLIAVEAVVLADVAPEALADCRARLVDASARQVLATGAFRIGAPLWAGAALPARAELPAPAGLRALIGSGAAWIEIVGDERRPVHGTRLRRMRRALRWADAALRAESRPNRLAPEFSDEQWTCLAGLAWNRCRADWEAAGDPGRAGLAAVRGTALRGALGGAPRSGASLGGLLESAAVRPARPFLAELVCDPAVTG
jgi:hypothetical protein